MKTNITSWGRKALKGIKNLFLVAFMVSISNQALAQTSTKVGLTLSRSSSGNGFGAFYNPGITINHNRSQFMLAAKIQQTKMHLSGGQMSFEFAVMEGSNEPGCRTELFVFTTTKFIHTAFLTKRNSELERWVNKESQTDFNNLKFTTFEAYAGFGAKLWLSEKVKLGSSIGFGGYGTLNKVGNLNRESKSMSISFNLGITANLN